MTVKRALTTGVMAERLGVPLHKIEYLISSRRIQPVTRAGNLRVFDEGAVDRLRSELEASRRG